jgi:hypothetical protein
MSGNAASSQLARSTLTNLYDQRPTWLDLAHRKLDEVVFAAYGWDAASDEEIQRDSSLSTPNANRRSEARQREALFETQSLP